MWYLARGLNNVCKKVNITTGVALQTYQNITLQRIEDYYEKEFNEQLQRISYKDSIMAIKKNTMKTVFSR